jgi:acyl phosphate:glycerol-3-phosphate acyltransferase
MPTDQLVLKVLVLLAAYVLGSIPSALILSRLVAGVDIRELGDANMGARNVTRTLGWKPGLAVALVDISKGGLAVLLAQACGLDLGWRIGAGYGVVLGHDFPLFAGLRGGQGLATTAGVLLALVPEETLIGLVVYGLLYLVTRHSDLSAGTGMGLAVFLMWRWGEPPVLLISMVALILTIPAKMLLDRPRRLHVRGA